MAGKARPRASHNHCIHGTVLAPRQRSRAKIPGDGKNKTIDTLKKADGANTAGHEDLQDLPRGFNGVYKIYSIAIFNYSRLAR